jgi:hypothetical protein
MLVLILELILQFANAQRAILKILMKIVKLVMKLASNAIFRVVCHAWLIELVLLMANAYVIVQV